MATAIRILVIDDNAEHTKNITSLLKQAARSQFAVETVSSATDGMAMLHRNKFDVVLLDCCLPDMDGVTFLDILRAERFRIPVVVMTDHHDKEAQTRVIEHGAAEYLEKGEFNSDLLERTCVYAIGLQEKQNASDTAPGVGLLITELVDLTRDSVKAQTASAVEIKELRQELTDGFKSMKDTIADHHKAALKIEMTALGIQDRIIKELQQIGKIRWVLDWIKTNPAASITIFLCLVIILVLGILFFITASPDQIKAATDAAQKFPEIFH